MTTSLTLPPSLIDQSIQTDPRLQSPHSRRQYSANLRKFEAWRADRPMTKLLVETYAAELQQQDLAPSTINQKLAAVRWWARKVIDLAHENLPTDEADTIAKQAARVLTIQDVKGKRPQRGRQLKSSELVALIQTCLQDPTPAGKRDAALFWCASTTGLRREELASITLENIKHLEEMDEETGEISHHAEISVIGKGNKANTAYLWHETYTALNAWLDIRGDEPGHVFCPINKSGAPLITSGLSGEALRNILNKRIAQAGIDHLTWHDFRRTLTGDLLNAKNDLVTVQKLLGHASPTTTAMYDRRPAALRKDAIKNLRMPKIGEIA